MQGPAVTSYFLQHISYLNNVHIWAHYIQFYKNSHHYPYHIGKREMINNQLDTVNWVYSRE